MISNFFHTPRSKKFYITPRFHDPAEDERKEREERIKSELGYINEAKSDENYKVNIKGQFQRRKGAGGSASESENRAYKTRLYGLIFTFSLIVIAVIYMEEILKFYDTFIK